MKWIPKILNALLTAGTAGLFTMLFSRYYLPVVPAICIGVVLFLGLFAVLTLSGGHKNRKKARSRREQALRAALLTMPVSKRRRFLFDAIRVHTPATVKRDAAFVTENGVETVLVDRLRYKKLTGDEVVEIRSRFPDKKVCVLCDAFDAGAGEAGAILDVKLVHGHKMIDILDALHAYPRLKKLPDRHGGFRRLYTAALNPARVRGYLTTAFILAFSGLFTRYRIYYLAFAVLACALAAVSLADPFRARENLT